MSDLRDRIAEASSKPIRFTAETTREVEAAGGGPVALRWEEAAQLADAVMGIVADLAADLDHAERDNRRLTAELAKLKR